MTDKTERVMMKGEGDMKKRNMVVVNMMERKASAGAHRNRKRDVAKGSSRKQKHKKSLAA